MIGFFRRAWVLAIMVSLAAWSQAQICPMMLQGRAPSCARPAARNVKPVASHHSCCPRGSAQAKSHCANTHLSMGDHAMPCCALDPPPATAPKVFTSNQQQVVIALLHAFFPAEVSPQYAVATPVPQPPGNPVFRLKEDLRI